MTTSKTTESILATVNEGQEFKLSEEALLHCLQDPAFAEKMPEHMERFFGTLTPDDQRAFAAEHRMATGSLVRAARKFARFSGKHYPILD